MIELRDVFAELGISHYLQNFVQQGFNTWESLFDIRESDFDALGVKLGHRRKLQRKIANLCGISPDKAIASTRNTPTDGRQSGECQNGDPKVDDKDANLAIHGAKRRYTRHPRPDHNAPDRPPSAYVIFLHTVREESRGQNLSFAEMAKHVGERWQRLSPGEKGLYVQQAFSTKERYNNELAKYKRTDNYKEYSQYLAEFMARQSTQLQSADIDSVKRPKPQTHSSTASTGTGCSEGSQHDGATSTSTIRVGSSASMSRQWHTVDAVSSSHLSGAPNMPLAHGRPKKQLSPNTTAPTVLLGYRELDFSEPHQALSWRDTQRDHGVNSVQQVSLIAVSGDRLSYSRSASDKLNVVDSSQHAYRTSQTDPPFDPLNRFPASSGSTAFSAHFAPRTPAEPPPNRILPISSGCLQEANGAFHNQLPPLRPLFLSQPSTSLSSQQPPKHLDSLSSIDPLQSYTSTDLQPIGQDEHSQSKHRDLMTLKSGDEKVLDPISALLRAADIVASNSGGRPGS